MENSGAAWGYDRRASCNAMGIRADAPTAFSCAGGGDASRVKQRRTSYVRTSVWTAGPLSR
ncbi:hypothetical protein SGFS_025220 [Streptomyces graminofaciens]|uniref:Uncharacterized protein n=1 Tax=Streptomyces graminofaciens TaxID=68212 RepID=A0ABN5VG58_9ACTN|nr:hypothetical protein SGFS_025220 [Streptomyces graminofaciens]